MTTIHHTLIEGRTIVGPLTEDELVQTVGTQFTIDLPSSTDPWRYITFHGLSTDDPFELAINAYTFGDRMVATSLLKFSCDTRLEITGNSVNVRLNDSWIKRIHTLTIGNDYYIPHVIISYTLT